MGQATGLDCGKLRVALTHERFEWRRHALEQIASRGIAQEDVLAALREGEMIRGYPDDRPHPSALFLHHMPNGPLHVVAAYDEAGDWAYVITAYRPDLAHYLADWRTRRQN